MTEHYTPSDYVNHMQNPRIDQLESLITAEYQPPQGAQYSYPIANQGITQDQWQQMMLSMGDGAIVTEDSEHFFRLVKHDTDAETNQRNTLIMKVAQNTGRNEASLAGFYFRQTEDIELPFPPVTSTTVYHVTVTYDPRKFKTEPLRLEVWAGEPPRAHGQRHLVLRTVRREANQLLSQALISTLRHYVSPVITAVTEAGLPDSKDVLYGTLGIVRSRTSGGTVVPGTGSIFESRGIHGWHKLLGAEWDAMKPGPWVSCGVFDSQGWSGYAYARKKIDGVDLRLNISGTSGAGAHGVAQINLPSSMALKETFYGVVMTTNGPHSYRVGHAGSGRHAGLQGGSSRPSWTRGNLFIPDYYLAN